MYKIAITTGDIKGIGDEITQKALRKLNLPTNEILIIGHEVDKRYDTIKIDDSNNGEFCYKTLECAANLALENKISAIVTAPVSKYALLQAGYNFSGQTEVLQKLLGADAEMLFIADDFRVMLLTRHLALKDVKITKDMITDKITRLNTFLKKYCKIENPKIAMCTLNPHAGEGGMLGREEIEIITPAIKKLNEEGIEITEPKSADALFARVGKKYLTGQKQDYDAIVACYHDQGLCPVKALCFDKTVNTTIGLKVIRTSPSCGTAYDIAGKGIADETSMVEAIKTAYKLSSNA